MNGWFPRINRAQDVISGNSGLWLTQQGVSVQIAPTGTTPCWAGFAPVWNMNDGHSRFNGGHVVDRAYSEYRGRDDGYWAGAIQSGAGQVDLYENAQRVASIPGATLPRLGGGRFVFVTPYQGTTNRSLVVDFMPRQTGAITNATISPDGSVLIYQTNYAHIWPEDKPPTGTPLNARPQETPVAAFIGPDGAPWVVCETPEAGGLVLVRPAFSVFGYAVRGELYNSDWRMQGPSLRGVASSSTGMLREVTIDFTVPRQDLRLL